MKLLAGIAALVASAEGLNVGVAKPTAPTVSRAALSSLSMSAHTGTRSAFAERALEIVAAHNIVKSNPYCEWFGNGEATVAEAQDLVVQARRAHAAAHSRSTPCHHVHPCNSLPPQACFLSPCRARARGDLPHPLAVLGLLQPLPPRPALQDH